MNSWEEWNAQFFCLEGKQPTPSCTPHVERRGKSLEALLYFEQGLGWRFVYSWSETRTWLQFAACSLWTRFQRFRTCVNPKAGVIGPITWPKQFGGWFKNKADMVQGILLIWKKKNTLAFPYIKFASREDVLWSVMDSDCFLFDLSLNRANWGHYTDLLLYSLCVVSDGIWKI